MEHRVLLVGTKSSLRRNDLSNGNHIRSPAMRCGHRLNFLVAFRQGHVEDRFIEARSFYEELKGQRRFARAGHAFDKIESAWRKTASEHVVQPANPATRHEGCVSWRRVF